MKTRKSHAYVYGCVLHCFSNLEYTDENYSIFFLTIFFFFLGGGEGKG